MRRFFAEWEPQSLVEIVWPDSKTDWAPILSEVEQCYLQIAEAIALRQPLLIVARCKADVESILLSNNNIAQIVRATPEQISITEQPIDDTWARDHGFLCVEDHEHIIGLDYQFNGWGLKFAASRDNQLNQKLFKSFFCKKKLVYENHLSTTFEGGSIESDGCGTLLTTSECLLSPNRNGADSREEIENRLLADFGANRVLWLDHGYLAGDDTDSHIDTLARLAPNDTILYVQCTNRTDEHFAELQKMEAQLRTFRTANGKPYHLVPLPMVSPIFCDGERLPATYANFLYINGAVLLPVYGAPEDNEAIATMKTTFPDREIVPINCLALIKQHGSLHCSAMQFPRFSND